MEVMLLLLGVIIVVFAGLTITFISTIVRSNKADRLLREKNLLGYSDALLYERERERQREYWKKYHPRDCDPNG